MRTVLDQGHLCPPSRRAPVVGAYDRARRRPRAALADSAGAFAAHGGVAALNPGGFADEPVFARGQHGRGAPSTRVVRAAAAAPRAAAAAAAAEPRRGRGRRGRRTRGAPRGGGPRAKRAAAKGPVVKQTKITFAFGSKDAVPASPTPSAGVEEDGADGADLSDADVDADVDMAHTDDPTAWADDAEETGEAGLGAAADDDAMALDGVLAH